MKVKELLKLPIRDWTKITVYPSIAVVNSRKKHDSGWALMAIIGLNKEQEPIEIAAYCDDISWDLNGLSLQNDMYYPSGVIRFWSRESQFEVGHGLSSTEIRLISILKKTVNN